MKITEGGWAGLREWNPSYRANHRPAWFKDKVRLLNKLKTGVYKPWEELNISRVGSGWDHTGSISICGEFDRAVYSMPYGNHDESMQKFADEHYMGLDIQDSSPWNTATRLYIFRKNNKENQNK